MAETVTFVFGGHSRHYAPRIDNCAALRVAQDGVGHRQRLILLQFRGRSFANEEWRNRGVPDLSNSVGARRASRTAMVAFAMILQSAGLKRL
jgi:hypothetical protein